MTNLLEIMFSHLDNDLINNYLAPDREYRAQSVKADQWAAALSERLDQEGQELFSRLQKAVHLTHYRELQAMFQATLALCRELRGVL